jgi:hypothetical protein
LAAIVFTAMLLGGGAAALSILAAAMTALSGVYSTRTAVPVESPAVQPGSAETTVDHSAVVTSQNESSQVEGATNPGSQSVNSSSGFNATNDETAAFDSPLEQSLDHGGLALGKRVHQTFGRILSGVLQTLFLDQPADRQSGGQ